MIELRPTRESDAAAVVALMRTADDTRVVSEPGVVHNWRTQPAEARALDLVAVEGDRVLARGAAGLNTWTSTPGAAWANVIVAPERRREGIGSRLGSALIDHLRAQDAVKATAFVRQTDEAERWARERGWQRVINGLLIGVDPRRIAEPELPDGFRCVPFSELEPTAVYETMCDAALDEPNAVPNDRIELAEFEREWEDPDIDLHSSVAVLDGDRVVSFSILKVAGDRGQHGFAGTASDYRGRGLATAAKRAALRAAAGRGVQRVTTSNAEENAAMRHINRQLGFEPVGHVVILARDL